MAFVVFATDRNAPILWNCGDLYGHNTYWFGNVGSDGGIPWSSSPWDMSSCKRRLPDSPS